MSVEVSSVCWLLSAMPESPQFSTWPFPKGKVEMAIPFWYMRCSPVSRHPAPVEAISEDPRFYAKHNICKPKVQSDARLSQNKTKLIYLQLLEKEEEDKKPTVFNVPYCKLLPPTATLVDFKLNIEPAKCSKLKLSLECDIYIYIYIYI